MSKIKILSDSTCDLPKDIIKKYDIGILPLFVNLDGHVYKDDGAEITSHMIFDYVARTGVLPGTIGVSVDNFRTEFEKWHELGYEIICHTISSDLSCSFQNANIAADGLSGVFVVDSRNLCCGVGLLVMNSAELADEGMMAEDIVKSTESLTSKVNCSFVIDTIDYLRKGGRCSTVAALGANIFKIKPMIVVEDGSMKVGNKFRGLQSKVLQEYVDKLFEVKKDIDTRRIFLASVGCSQETVELVRDRIKKRRHFDEIIEATAGATITSHCGPNTVGIMFLER